VPGSESLDEVKAARAQEVLWAPPRGPGVPLGADGRTQKETYKVARRALGAAKSGADRDRRTQREERQRDLSHDAGSVLLDYRQKNEDQRKHKSIQRRQNTSQNVAEHGGQKGGQGCQKP